MRTLLLLLYVSAPSRAAPHRAAFVVNPAPIYPPARRRMDSPRLQEPRSVASSPDAASASDTPLPEVSPDAVFDATTVLSNYDAAQRAFIDSDGSRGMGGGTSALSYLRTLTESDRSAMRDAVVTIVRRAASERAEDSSKGRVMMGFCAENAPEALGGLRMWVTALGLPRGMLHGMDVEGVPIAPEELGSVYVKYSTGGAMTFSEMRKSGMGFDALWRPGDALLEPYDGDFRGVYLNVELGDEVFRQFGVLPTDLFMEEEDW